MAIQLNKYEKTFSKQIICQKIKESKDITSIERVLAAQWKFLISAYFYLKK